MPAAQTTYCALIDAFRRAHAGGAAVLDQHFLDLRYPRRSWRPSCGRRAPAPWWCRPGCTCRPSGRRSPPSTSSALSSGHFSWHLGAVELRRTAPRSACSMSTPRSNSSKRSSLVAIESEPGCTKPVACPVSGLERRCRDRPCISRAWSGSRCRARPAPGPPHARSCRR